MSLHSPRHFLNIMKRRKRNKFASNYSARLNWNELLIEICRPHPILLKEHKTYQWISKLIEVIAWKDKDHIISIHRWGKPENRLRKSDTKLIKTYSYEGLKALEVANIEIIRTPCFNSISQACSMITTILIPIGMLNDVSKVSERRT